MVQLPPAKAYPHAPRHHDPHNDGTGPENGVPGGGDSRQVLVLRGAGYRATPWDCVPTRHVVNHLLEGCYAWLDQHWYVDRVVERAVVEETRGASYIVVWCMATTTDAFRTEGLSVATQDSVGVQFLQ